ncbi:RsmB/NOP family class I SAM-dependent RNA methyltransferase [Candidatus Woesearchaeota archaeon]|nr:RsmB/NOP family class I SAM-dependent RNA methyltransferase [Candidatus Woesearchaeota archaeon]
MEFKEKFLQKYSSLTDIDLFIEFSLKDLCKSIRVNTLKISVKELKKRMNCYEFRQVPWCKEGFFVKGERTDLGNLREHQLGFYYIQESASMIPPIVLNPKVGDIVLDACASPGSKTTQMAAMMHNEGIIVANDIKDDRIRALSTNLQRCGVSNVVLTKSWAESITMKFDKILLDAPCSGTGTIRKSLKTIKIWNPNMYKKLAGAQKGLISHCFDILRENGTMVYSTCSISPEENEEVVNFLLQKYENARLEEISLNIKRSNPVLESKGEILSKDIKKCLRIWPQDNDTSGFFVAKIRKD